MTCKHCGTECPDGANFCIKCGGIVTDKKACPACNTLVPEESVYCYSCGYRLDGKKTCVCGTEIGAEDDYCCVCGAKQTKQKSPKTRKITKAYPTKLITLLGKIFAGASAIFAVLFLFAVGLKLNADADLSHMLEGSGIDLNIGNNIFDIMFGGLRAAAIQLEAMHEYTGIYEISLMLEAIINLVVCTVGIACTLTFGIIGIVRFIKSLTGKTEKSVLIPCAASAVSYITMCAILSGMVATSMHVSASGEVIEFSSSLNGATKTGIVLATISLLLAVIAEVFKNGKSELNAKKIFNYAFSGAMIVFGLACISALGEAAILMAETAASGETITLETSGIVLGYSVIGSLVTFEGLESYGAELVPIFSAGVAYQLIAIAATLLCAWFVVKQIIGISKKHGKGELVFTAVIVALSFALFITGLVELILFMLQSEISTEIFCTLPQAAVLISVSCAALGGAIARKILNKKLSE